MKLLAVFLLTACVAGCAAFGAQQADRYYILDAGPAPQAASNRRVGVEAAPTTAVSFYDTQDIVFSRAPGTRGYYQFNHWTERPQRAIHAQLAARLAGAADDSAYIVATHVNEIYHDAVEAPGSASVSLTAQLIDAKSKRIVATRTFARSAAAATFDAPGAVHAFDEALRALLDDVVEWIGAEIEARQPQRLGPTATATEAP